MSHLQLLEKPPLIPPRWIGKKALTIWYEHVDTLIEQGYTSDNDRCAFACYCEFAPLYRWAVNQAQRGYVSQRPTWAKIVEIYSSGPNIIAKRLPLPKLPPLDEAIRIIKERKQCLRSR